MYGTLAITDLLRTKFQNILDYGEDRVFDQISRQLTAYNTLTREMLSSLVEFSTERIEGFGITGVITPTKVGEFARVDTQKIAPGSNFGFPLRLSQAALQWTRLWFENHTPAELANQYVAIQSGDTLEIQNDLRNAFFGSSNYNAIDDLVDNLTLPVKRLINADGLQIPVGPNGEIFDPNTHTHYTGSATLTDTVMSALVTNVAEHYKVGQIYILANAAQEGASGTANTIRNLSNFVPIVPTTTIPASTVTVGRGSLDSQQLYNRQIGFYGNQSAQVWIKPWIPAGYILCLIMGPMRKVLRMRERRNGSSNLRMQVDHEQFPLRTQAMDREMGFGVQERTAAAVLYTGGSSYVDITF